LYFLTLAGNSLEPLERRRLELLHGLIDAVLARPDLTGREAANMVEQRRAAAARLVTNTAVKERIEAAPRAYVLRTPPDELARHAALCEPPLGRDVVRSAVTPIGPGSWRIDFAARDRVGLLAH